MSLIKEDLFCEILAEPAHSLRNQLRSELMHLSPIRTLYPTAARTSNDDYEDWGRPPANFLPASVNREAALEMLQSLKAYACQHGSLGGKYLRPYQYDPMEYLDRSQAWWGFEFECGFLSRESRAEAIAYAWDVANGVSFDMEGEGNFVSEVTFLPAEESAFLDKTAPAYRYMQWCSDHPSAMMRTGRTNVGTHLNISHPGMNSAATQSLVCYLINNSIHHLPFEMNGKNVRELLFGRSSIYAGGGSRTSQTAGRWIEFKIFRTTYDIGQFDQYIQTCRAITKATSAVLAQAETDPGILSQARYMYVTNLYEMFSDPTIEPVIAVNTDYNGSGSPDYINHPSQGHRAVPARGILSGAVAPQLEPFTGDDVVEESDYEEHDFDEDDDD